METGDQVEDYPEYMRNAVNDIGNGDFATEVIGFVKLMIGIVIFHIIIIINLLS